MGLRRAARGRWHVSWRNVSVMLFLIRARCIARLPSRCWKWAVIRRALKMSNRRYVSSSATSHSNCSTVRLSAAMMFPKRASKVTALPEVRLAQVQTQITENPPGDVGGAVLDGRDIGTAVCPTADIKLFVTATAEERARRRFNELHFRHPALTLDKVLEDIRARVRRSTTSSDADGRRRPAGRPVGRPVGGRASFVDQHHIVHPCGSSTQLECCRLGAGGRYRLDPDRITSSALAAVGEGE